jgi:hypothetical protein
MALRNLELLLIPNYHTSAYPFDDEAQLREQAAINNEYILQYASFETLNSTPSYHSRSHHHCMDTSRPPRTWLLDCLRPRQVLQFPKHQLLPLSSKAFATHLRLLQCTKLLRARYMGQRSRLLLPVHDEQHRYVDYRGLVFRERWYSLSGALE